MVHETGLLVMDGGLAGKYGLDCAIDIFGPVDDSISSRLVYCCIYRKFVALEDSR